MSFQNVRRVWIPYCLLLATIVVSVGVAHGQTANKGNDIIQVTTTADVVDGDTTSLSTIIATPGPDNAISFREALMAANNTTGPETISFASVGEYTVTSALPALNDATGLIEIMGEGKPTLLNGTGDANVDGLTILSADNVISGITIRGFNAAIRMTGSGADANNVISSVLGDVLEGIEGTPNQYGIVLETAAQSNVIGGINSLERNVISGNSFAGILLRNGADFAVVQGNYIGVGPDGRTAVPNGGQGILIDGVDDVTIGYETFGGVNVISGNVGDGIEIRGDSTDNRITDNIIGLSFDENDLVPNNRGIYIDGTDGASGTEIGSLQALGNTISGNIDAGIEIFFSENNSIQRNSIGIQSNTFNEAPNGGAGIRLTGGARDNTIGNALGTLQNQIAYNKGDGIHVDGASSRFNLLQRNRIFQNGGEGIRISGNAQDGITPPTINALAIGDQVTGQTVANGTVHLFRGEDEEGDIFLSSVMADGNGAFTIPLPYVTYVEFLTATVTDSNSNTSAFSMPQTIPIAFTGDIQQTTEVFLDFDSDHNDHLEASEYLLGTGRTLNEFNLADVDGNGLLTFYELLKQSQDQAGVIEIAIDTTADLVDAPNTDNLTNLLNDRGPDAKISLREACWPPRPQAPASVSISS